MLPAYSVWCDPSAVTDPALLEGLGRLNPNTAVGVMCNPHLTGARLARVAENANVLVKLLDVCDGGRPIMAGRSTEDQVTIMEAAVERSTAGARQLSSHLNPEAALLLHRRWTNHRLASHRDVAAAIEHRNAVLMLAHYDHPAFAETVEALSPDQAPELLVIADAYNATSADDLLALTARVAELRTRGHATRYLPLVVHPYPEVSEHWARHGGPMGALVAAGDHRLSTDLLVGLFDTYAENDTVLDALMVNPSVPEKLKSDWISEAFSERVEEALTSGGHMHSFDLHRHVASLHSLRETFGAADVRDLPGTMTAQAARNVLNAHRLKMSPLLYLDLAIAVKSHDGDEARVTLWDLVGGLLNSAANPLPPSAANRLADLLDRRLPWAIEDDDMFGEDSARDLSRRLVDHLTRGRTCLVELNPVPQDPEDAPWQRFLNGLTFDGPSGAGRHRAAAAVRDLNEVGEFVELFSLAEIAKSQQSDVAAGLTPHGDLVDVDEPYLSRIERVRGAGVAAPSFTAMSDLVPSALGSL